MSNVDDLRNILDDVLSDFEKVKDQTEIDKIEPFDENGKVQKFNKTVVETVSKDLFAEFRKLAKEKYGLNIKFGNIRFTDADFSCKLEFEILTEKGYPKPSLIELRELKENAIADGLIKKDELIYEKKYVTKNDSKIITIIGYNSRKKKQPYIVMVNKSNRASCNYHFLKNSCIPIEDIESV